MKDKITFKRFNGKNLVLINGKILKPEPSQKIYNHSPDGFNWGYSGSGPAQTALAICLKLTENPQKALRVHQRFKDHFIAGIPAEGGELDLGDVSLFLKAEGTENAEVGIEI